MPKMYIITSGTSLLSNYFDKSVVATRDIKEFDNYLAGINADKYSVLGKDFCNWVGNNGNFQGSTNIIQWIVDTFFKLRVCPNYVFAELATLKKLDLTKDDKFVILISDTLEGVFCGVMLAFILSNPAKKIKTRYYKDTIINFQIDTQGFNGANRFFPLSDTLEQQVEVIHIPQLDPKNKKNFENQGVGRLTGVLIEEIFSAYQGCGDTQYEPEIVFTGGFKACIPIITQVASWMKGVPMVALYEDSKDIIKIDVVPAPPDIELLKLMLRFRSLTCSKNDRLYNICKNIQPDQKPNWQVLNNEQRKYFNENPFSLNLLGKALMQYTELAYMYDPDIKYKLDNAF